MLKNLLSIGSNALTKSGGLRTLRKVDHLRPEILLGGGIVLGIAAAALAVHNTLKHRNELINAIELPSDYKDGVLTQELEDELNSGSTSPEVKMYGNIAKVGIKTYGPPALMGAVSVYMILSSHGVMKQRNAELISFAAFLQTNFTAYRKRVSAEVGEQKEFVLYHNLKEVTETEVDEEGKKTKIKKVDVPLPWEESMYARVFDSTNQNFSPTRAINEHMLRSTQTLWNHMLATTKVVLLNDVYKDLGFKPTAAGAVVGWVWDPNEVMQIDFNLDNPANSDRRSNRFLVDFNVQGVVYEHLGD